MPYKDPVKKKEYLGQWRKKNPNYYRERWRNKNPMQTYHDFETHHQLAINSGIETVLEWVMCHKMGLFPDGIYANPNQAFGRQ